MPHFYRVVVGGIHRCQRLVNRSKTGTRCFPSVFVQQNFAARQNFLLHPCPAIFLWVSSPTGDRSLKTHKLISSWLFWACLYMHMYLLLCQIIFISWTLAKYCISMCFWNRNVVLERCYEEKLPVFFIN